MNFKAIFCSVWLCVLGVSCVFAGPPRIGRHVQRVLFLGNSITYNGQYITDVETWFTLHYPKQKVVFINEGLPSETVSGLSEAGHAGGRFPRPDLHERLARVLAVTHPDMVFACYGMNDGIYMPFDTTRFNQFKQGIAWLHNQLIQAGIKTIVHITPPVFDEHKGGHKGYSAALDTYADWLLRCRDSLKWNVADVHFAMKQYLQTKRAQDSTYFFARDGVHPDSIGHWVMAKQLLLYIGATNVADAAQVQDIFKPYPYAQHIWKFIAERQAFMKDAWLTAAGHKRPGMKTGIPLAQALARYDEVQRQIDLLTGR
jgi:lysophospholipase L1-like esterase